MNEINPLESAQWHRVASLRPMLAAQVRSQRMWLRGQRWYVLHRPDLEAPSAHCRLNQQAYDIAARMDGRITLEDLWKKLDYMGSGIKTEPPSQEDMVGVLTLLIRHQLVTFDETPDFGALASATKPAKPFDESASKPPSSSNTFWHWRVSFGDPSAWLDKQVSFIHLLISPAALWVWLLLMLTLLGGSLLHATALKAHATTWLSTPSHVLLAMVLYPCIKGLHETAHAMAIHRWGGRVRACGLAFMMLMPVPYVDASAAHGFVKPYQRALVSAAGIMAELTLATLGLWLWIGTEPGGLHHLGFVTWFIACVSTLLFNGNPLQKFDGYHVLTDALQLPGLAQRSRQWWTQHLHHWALGTSGQETHRLDTAPAARGEHTWLWLYAPLAWLYQLALWTALSAWIGSVSAQLGWLLAGYSLWTLVIKPAKHGLLSWWSLMLQANTTAPTQQRAPWQRLGVLLVLPMLAVLTPMPDQTVVQGIVSVPERALVRADVDGFVEEVLQADGSMVRAGQALVKLHNPRLLAQRERVQAQMARAEQTQFTHMGVDDSKAGQASDEALQLQSQLGRLTQQIDALTIRAQHAGRLNWPIGNDLSGRYLARGTLIGHILEGQAPMVRIAVGQDQGIALRERTQQVSVRWNDTHLATEIATMKRDSVGATRTLPSAALSDAMGGQVATDPTDEQHLRTLHPVVWMDIQLMARASGNTPARLGERVWVRMAHGWSPLAWQWGRWAQQQAKQRFNPRS